MKANRKTMLGVALAVAVIALAGIGYAVTDGFKAVANSSGNQVTSEYGVIKLTDGNSTAVYEGQTVKIDYDTETLSETQVKYKMRSSSVTMTFDIDFTVVGEPNDSYKLKITGLNPELNIPGAKSAVWTVGDKTLTSGTSLEVTGNQEAITGMVLTLTITAKDTDDGWTTVAPTELPQPVNIAQITFTVTNQAE